MAHERPTGAAVLAAGASRRFGDEDKLAARLRGRALSEHVCAAIPAACFAKRWVIARSIDHPCVPAWRARGFCVAANPRAAQGLGTSLALAARLAREAGCEGLVIALADMPFVPASHFEALARRMLAAGSEAIIASGHGEKRSVPAAFGSAQFARLERLAADAGARGFLREGEVVECPEQWLFDIDTPGDLARLG